MTNDIVKIVVEVVDRFSKELRKAEARFEQLTRRRDSNVDVSVRGEAEARAKMAALARDQTKGIRLRYDEDRIGNLPSISSRITRDVSALRGTLSADIGSVLRQIKADVARMNREVEVRTTARFKHDTRKGTLSEDIGRLLRQTTADVETADREVEIGTTARFDRDGLRRKLTSQIGSALRNIKADAGRMDQEVVVGTTARFDREGLRSNLSEGIGRALREIKADVSKTDREIGFKTTARLDHDGLRGKLSSDIGSLLRKIKADVSQMNREIEVRTTTQFHHDDDEPDPDEDDWSVLEPETSRRRRSNRSQLDDLLKQAGLRNKLRDRARDDYPIGTSFDLKPFQDFQEKHEDLVGKTKGKKGGAFRQLSRGIRRLLPSYQKWIQLVSILLPMVIALSVALVGLAAAAVAVVGAGGAMLGLGLLGEGDTMAEAFENARRRLGRFKKELFATFQPAAKLFAPFSQRFLELSPGWLQPLARATETLIVFQDLFERSFRGVVEWSARGITAMAGYRQEIDTLLSTFGPAAGDAIIGFLSFAIEEAIENRGVLLKLGNALRQVLRVVYEFSLFLGQLAVVFAPVVSMVGSLAEIFQNKLVVSLVATLVTFGLLMTGAWKVILLFVAMKKAIIAVKAGFIAFKAAGAGMAGVVAAITAVNAGLTKTTILAGMAAGILSAGFAVAVGAAAYSSMKNMTDDIAAGSGSAGIGAGIRPGGYAGSYAPAAATGSTVNYEINIENMDKKERHNFESTFNSLSEKENSRNPSGSV
jgi:hypothetical protein